MRTLPSDALLKQPNNTTQQPMSDRLISGPTHTCFAFNQSTSHLMILETPLETFARSPPCSSSSSLCKKPHHDEKD